MNKFTSLVFCVFGIVCVLAAFLVTMQHSPNVLLDDHAQWTSDRLALETKFSTLKKLQGSVGYHGVIHSFKDYVMHGEERQYKDVAQQIKVSRKHLADLTVLLENQVEESSFAPIHSVLDHYELQLPLVREARASGKQPADDPKTLTFDDKPALQALDTIHDTLEREYVRLQDNFSSAVSVSASSKSKHLWVVALLLFARRQQRRSMQGGFAFSFFAFFFFVFELVC